MARLSPSRLTAILTGWTSNPINEYFLLAAISLVGIALRFYKLGEWSFWEDEIFTLTGKEDGFNYNIWRQSSASVLIRLVAGQLGTSEWSARLVPALAGALSIPILFFLVKRLFNPLTAIIFSTLLAVSVWHIYWSQTARFYTLLLLFHSLALFIFQIALEESRPWLLGVAVLFLSLAARERLIALMYLPCIACYLGVLAFLPGEKPFGFNLRKLTIVALPVVVLGLIFAGPYLLNISEWMAGFRRINTQPEWILAGVSYYVGVPTITLAGGGMLYLLAQKKRAGLYFGLAGIVPLLIVMGMSTFQYSANRYALITLPSFLVLASVAAAELIRSSQGPSRLLAVFPLLVLLSSSLSEDILYFKFQNGNRPQWREAFQFILEYQRPDDRILSTDPDLANHYTGQETMSMEGIDLSRLENGNRRVWIVQDSTVEERYPVLMEWIHDQARLAAIYDVNVHPRLFKMRVYLYNPPSGDLLYSAGSD